MDDRYSFGEWVQRRRRSHLLTQAELARRIGVATVTLHKIETDARSSHYSVLQYRLYRYCITQRYQ